MSIPFKSDLLKLPKNWDGVEEYTEILLSGENWRLERIVSRGHISPPGFWYEQTEDEWVMVIQGTGEIMWADGLRCVLNKGESVLIPRYCRHRVSMTSAETECIWLCLFFDGARAKKDL